MHSIDRQAITSDAKSKHHTALTQKGLRFKMIEFVIEPETKGESDRLNNAAGPMSHQHFTPIFLW